MPVTSDFQDEIFVVKVVGEYTYDEYVDAMVRGFSDPRFISTTPDPSPCDSVRRGWES